MTAPRIRQGRLNFRFSKRGVWHKIKPRMAPDIDIGKWKDYFGYDVNQAASELCDRPAEEIAAIGEALGVEVLSDITDRLGTDAAAQLLRSFPDELRGGILGKLPRDKGSLLEEILSYAP